MRRPFLILLSMSFSLTLTCQLMQDFDNGDLSIWQGDIADFAVNDDLELQLQAADGGISTIFAPVTFSDSIKWSVDVELKFDPSGSNNLVIWLAVDDAFSAIPTGYSLELGENGSADAIKLVSVDQGDKTTIAEGNMEQIASAFKLKIILTKDKEDNWTLMTQDESEQSPVEAFTVYYEDNTFPTSGNFGIECTYTSSRADLFYFDNVNVTDLLPDSEGPRLVSYTVDSPIKISLQYNEPLDDSALSTDNFRIDGLTIARSELVDERTICLTLTENIPSGTRTEMVIDGISDLRSNLSEAETIELVLTESPLPGDLLINEVLYNSLSGLSSDYVELINASNKFLSLKNIFLARAESTQKDVEITTDYILEPGDIIAFADDLQEIIDTYAPIPGAVIEELNIPTYVDKEGNVWLKSIVNNIETTIDSFDYNDDYHSALLTSANKEGVALERISTTTDTNEPSNWFSSSSGNNFGTPGYANSQAFTGVNDGENAITITNKLFTPNGDGDKDFLLLNYELNKPGYVANIKVYDDHGRFKANIAENSLLGMEGTLRWEGLLPDGYLAPVGMYIIYYDLFHGDGQVISGKKVCVLGQQL